MPLDFQHLGAHALDGGEVEQREADHEGGAEGLLPAQDLGALDPEEVHGEGRGGLDAHQREHVGQAHHGRPDDGLVGLGVGAGVAGDEHYGRHLEQALGQLVDRGRKARPAAELLHVDDVVAQEDDAAYEEYELKHADPGAGLHAARAHVEPDDEGHDPGAPDEVDARDPLEERGRGHHLHRRVEQRIQQGHNDHQKAQELAVVIVGVLVAGGDEPVALAEQPLALGEEGPGNGNCEHVKRREGI